MFKLLPAFLCKNHARSFGNASSVSLASAHDHSASSATTGAMPAHHQQQQPQQTFQSSSEASPDWTSSSSASLPPPATGTGSSVMTMAQAQSTVSTMVYLYNFECRRFLDYSFFNWGLLVDAPAIPRWSAATANVIGHLVRCTPASVQQHGADGHCAWESTQRHQALGVGRRSRLTLAHRCWPAWWWCCSTSFGLRWRRKGADGRWRRLVCAARRANGGAQRGKRHRHHEGHLGRPGCG